MEPLNGSTGRVPREERTTAAMDCRQFRNEVGEYPDREIPQSVKSALEGHAAACSNCAAELRVFRAMREGLSALPALAASKEFDARLGRRLSAERRGAAGGTLAFPSWARWVAVAAAAAVVLAIGALLLRSDGGARRIQGQVASGGSAIEVALPANGGAAARDGAAGADASRGVAGADAGRFAAADRGALGDGRSGLDAFLSEEGAALGGRDYVIDRPSDLPFLLPGGVEGEAASAPIRF